MAIKAVGKDGKTSGEDDDGWTFVRELSGSDESVRVMVTVDPGAGEGEGGVEIIRLVTVNGGLLRRLEGDIFWETELVSGGREGEEMLVGGKDEPGLIVSELRVDEGGVVEGREGVEDGRDGKERSRVEEEDRSSEF